MENSKSILETKEKVETEIKEVEHRLQEFEKNKLNLNIDIDSLKGYEKEWSNFVEKRDKEDKIDREISGLINKLSTIETEELRNQQQITQQDQLIKEYYKNEKQIKRNKEIRNDIVDVRSDLDDVKKIIKSNNSDILKLNGRISASSKSKRIYRR